MPGLPMSMSTRLLTNVSKVVDRTYSILGPSTGLRTRARASLNVGFVQAACFISTGIGFAGLLSSSLVAFGM